MKRVLTSGSIDLQSTHPLYFVITPLTLVMSPRFELLARLCPNCTGAELRSVCTEAGMFAIRSRRKVSLK